MFWGFAKERRAVGGYRFWKIAAPPVLVSVVEPGPLSQLPSQEECVAGGWFRFNRPQYSEVQFISMKLRLEEPLFLLLAEMKRLLRSLALDKVFEAHDRLPF